MDIHLMGRLQIPNSLSYCALEPLKGDARDNAVSRGTGRRSTNMKTCTKLQSMRNLLEAECCAELGRYTVYWGSLLVRYRQTINVTRSRQNFVASGGGAGVGNSKPPLTI